jgi:hypothetical protein
MTGTFCLSSAADAGARKPGGKTPDPFMLVKRSGHAPRKASVLAGVAP